jgi:hypothetical protein
MDSGYGGLIPRVFNPQYLGDRILSRSQHLVNSFTETWLNTTRVACGAWELGTVKR